MSSQTVLRTATSLSVLSCMLLGCGGDTLVKMSPVPEGTVWLRMLSDETCLAISVGRWGRYRLLEFNEDKWVDTALISGLTSRGIGSRSIVSYGQVVGLQVLASIGYPSPAEIDLSTFMRLYSTNITVTIGGRQMFVTPGESPWGDQISEGESFAVVDSGGCLSSLAVDEEGRWHQEPIAADARIAVSAPVDCFWSLDSTGRVVTVVGFFEDGPRLITLSGKCRWLELSERFFLVVDERWTGSGIPDQGGVRVRVFGRSGECVFERLGSWREGVWPQIFGGWGIASVRESDRVFEVFRLDSTSPR